MPHSAFSIFLCLHTPTYGENSLNSPPRVMSGLEAAGLILGLWPAVASLVKGYKATKNGEDCAAFLRDLKVQETVYKGCIRRLLQENEAFSNDEFINIEDGNAEISPWRDSLFQMHLKNRIGTENFTSIDDVLCSIDSTLKELKRQLQNGEADLVWAKPAP